MCRIEWEKTHSESVTVISGWEGAMDGFSFDLKIKINSHFPVFKVCQKEIKFCLIESQIFFIFI